MKGARPLSSGEISKAKDCIKGRWKIRNHALFVLGLNTGFRITELLSLTVADVVDKDGSLSKYATVARRHMKGSKEGRTVPLNAAAQAALIPWVKELALLGYTHKDDYVFQSQKGGNRAVSVVQGWRILEAAFRDAGMTGRLGTHAMRKTFANTIYEHFLNRVAKGEPIDAFRNTSKALDHKDIKSTDQYLSFRNEDVLNAINSLEN